ncbi:unnamed protein product [Leptosia nina]|uniref:Elongation of very long chain fatty acids protein n=1 Tax=Leptosia nina TaxID=320188 RepID=A0AAV1JVQ3_9NEOP
MDEISEHTPSLWANDEILQNWFLMGSPVPLGLLLASYWYFVLQVGPSYMSKRPPYNLTSVLAVYNVVQVLFSLRLFSTGAYILGTYGFFPTECSGDKYSEAHLLSLTGIYYFLLVKIIDLLDTVFFILRKKNNQASFLHIYHHSSMIILTWLSLKHEGNVVSIVFIGTLNSLVHVVMYTYYTLSAYPQFTKYLWWKKYLTKFQLAQFVILIAQLVLEYKFATCKPSYILVTTITLNLVLLIYLFSIFYIKTYTTKVKTNKTEKKSDDEVLLERLLPDD